MPISDPILEVLAPFRPLWSRTTMEKNDDLAHGNTVSSGATHSHGCSEANWEPDGEPLSRVPSGAQSGPLVSPSSESAIAHAHRRVLRRSRRQC